MENLENYYRQTQELHLLPAVRSGVASSWIPVVACCSIALISKFVVGTLLRFNRTANWLSGTSALSSLLPLGRAIVAARAAEGERARLALDAGLQEYLDGDGSIALLPEHLRERGEQLQTQKREEIQRLFGGPLREVEMARVLIFQWRGRDVSGLPQRDLLPIPEGKLGLVQPGALTAEVPIEVAREYLAALGWEYRLDAADAGSVALLSEFLQTHRTRLRALSWWLKLGIWPTIPSMEAFFGVQEESSWLGGLRVGMYDRLLRLLRGSGAPLEGCFVEEDLTFLDGQMDEQSIDAWRVGRVPRVDLLRELWLKSGVPFISSDEVNGWIEARGARA